MGKKDIADRPYFSDRRRFAELINATLYHGENVLLPESLTLLRRKYPSLTSSSGELERDILIMDKGQNICYGIEIETESDYSMPERVITYDACDYEYQMKEIDRGHRERKDYQCYQERKSRMKVDDILLPTITTVLYLGEGHWKGRRKLSQMFRLPQETRSLLGANLSEYSFPLIEADYVNLEYFGTDLREFFQAMQYRRDKTRLKILFQTDAFMHLCPETEHVIARHLHIQRLLHKMETEDLPMCKAFDDLMKDQLEEGKKVGRKEEKIQIIKQMLKEGLDEALIHRTTKCTHEEFAVASR